MKLLGFLRHFSLQRLHSLTGPQPGTEDDLSGSHDRGLLSQTGFNLTEEPLNKVLSWTYTYDSHHGDLKNIGSALSYSAPGQLPHQQPFIIKKSRSRSTFALFQRLWNYCPFREWLIFEFQWTRILYMRGHRKVFTNRCWETLRSNLV